MQSESSVIFMNIATSIKQIMLIILFSSNKSAILVASLWSRAGVSLFCEFSEVSTFDPIK